MKKGYLLIATMICLGAVILVGYQNCGLSGSKKSHTKVTPVNPDAKPTKGVVDSSKLNAAQVQKAGGVCDPATNTLMFSAQEATFKVNCKQLEELKVLIAPNILTAEYFRSGNILLDAAGNIIQVSIVSPPATPKMEGSVPSQMKAFQVVNAGLNTVNLTEGQNLVRVDLSKNYITVNPQITADAEVITTESLVQDKRGAYQMPASTVDLRSCHRFFQENQDRLYCEGRVTAYSNIQGRFDLSVFINNGTRVGIQEKCFPDASSTYNTSSINFDFEIQIPYPYNMRNLTFEVVATKLPFDSTCPGTYSPNPSYSLLAPSEVAIGQIPDWAFNYNETNGSTSVLTPNSFNVNIQYDFPLMDLYPVFEPRIYIYCDRPLTRPGEVLMPKWDFPLTNSHSFSQIIPLAGERCENPTFEIRSVPSRTSTIVTRFSGHEQLRVSALYDPPGMALLELTGTPEEGCRIAEGQGSCEVQYKLEAQTYLTQLNQVSYIGIFSRVVEPPVDASHPYDYKQLLKCVPVSYDRKVVETGVVNIGIFSKEIQAYMFSSSTCTGPALYQNGILIQKSKEYPVTCESESNRWVPGPLGYICADLQNTESEMNSFRFFNAPSDRCTVPSGKSFCSDDYRVKSIGSVSGLPTGKRILIQADGSGTFACLQNGDTLENLPGPGTAGEGTWIGNGYSVTFKAFVVDLAGNGCALPASNAIAIDTLSVTGHRE